MRQGALLPRLALKLSVSLSVLGQLCTTWISLGGSVVSDGAHLCFADTPGPCQPAQCSRFRLVQSSFRMTLWLSLLPG